MGRVEITRRLVAITFCLAICSGGSAQHADTTQVSTADSLTQDSIAQLPPLKPRVFKGYIDQSAFHDLDSSADYPIEVDVDYFWKSYEEVLFDPPSKQLKAYWQEFLLD
jgi:hypothetical protein